MSRQSRFSSPIPEHIRSNVILNSPTRAQKATHIVDQDIGLVGFSNNRPRYSNACFRNALISLLVNIPAFVRWVISRSPAINSDEPSVLFFLERLVRTYWSTSRDDERLQDSLDTAVELLYEHINESSARFPRSTQQDPAQLLMHLANLTYAELSSDHLQAIEFSDLLQTILVPYYLCHHRCGDLMWRQAPPSDWHKEPSLTTQPLRPAIAFSAMLETVFNPNPCLRECSNCGEVTVHDERRQILNPPEILFLNINHIDGGGLKSGVPVPYILEKIDLRKHLESDTLIQYDELRYRLIGCISHKGESLSDGHYVSHVQSSNGDWKELDDAQIKPSSLEHLQDHVVGKGLNQFFPQLLAYVRIHDDDPQNTDRRERSAIQNGDSNTQTGPGATPDAGSGIARAESSLPDYVDSGRGHIGPNGLLPRRPVEDGEHRLCHPCPYFPNQFHHQCRGACASAVNDSQVQPPPQEGNRRDGQSAPSEQTDPQLEPYLGDQAVLNIEVLAPGTGRGPGTASTYGNFQYILPFYDPAFRQPVEVTLELTTADGTKIEVVPDQGPTRTFAFQASDEV